MKNTVVKHTRRDQCLRPPKGAIITFMSLGLVFMAGTLEALGQESIGATVTNTSKQMINGTNTLSIGDQKTTEATKIAVLSKRLGGPVSEVLVQNQFVVWENEFLRRDRVAVGDLKKLLKYEDKDLKPLPSSSAGHPEYYLPFADVRCIIEVAEERKSIHDDATLVNVTINTNAVPISAIPMGTNCFKRAAANKSKPSDNVEKK